MHINFSSSDDSSKVFGAQADPNCNPAAPVAPCIGYEFYIQYREKVDDILLNTAYLGSNGWKSSIIGLGDRPGAVASSCTSIHIVHENSNLTGYPQMYHSCGSKDNSYQTLQSFIPATGDYFDQDVNLVAAHTACFHYGGRGTPPGVISCFKYAANEWMTFQFHVKVGTWYANMSGNYHHDSIVELWVAHPNQPSQLVISYNDYDLANDNPLTDKYGKIWLLPYQTNKNNTQVTPVGHMSFDDVIISKSRIHDPDVATPDPPDNLRATPTSTTQVNLSWRNNATDATNMLVERCVGNDSTCWAGYAAFTQIASLGGTATNFTDTGLTTNTTYTYRVRATNSFGNSAYAGGVCFRTTNYPSFVAGSSCFGTATTQ